MAPKKNIVYNVIKVPLKTENHNYPPKNFSPIGRMYLEIIQNKDKIKPELVGKDYIPKISEKSMSVNRETLKRGVKNIFKKKYRIEDNVKPFEKKEIVEPINEDKSVAEEKDYDSNTISDRLAQLLKKDLSDDDTPSPKKPQTPESVDKYSKKYNETFRSHSPKVTIEPPSLEQLKQTGEYKADKYIRNINSYTIDTESEDKKRELLFKFDMLKRQYKDTKIPEYTIHSDYNEMTRSYKDQVRKLTLDSSVNSYKKFLVLGFTGVEYILGNFLNLDMKGYASHQMNNMDSYERLLIELGEKTYTPKGSKWPVEIRLVFTVIINTGVFLVGKMFMKKTSMDLFSVMGSLNKKPTALKRKMRGPDINLNEFN